MEYKHPIQPSGKEQQSRIDEYYTLMDGRRSVRVFSEKQVPKSVIEKIILTASAAPSGAHKQPWTFCVVGNPEVKKAIRAAAEKEEYENYHGRMSELWLKDLEVFDTDWHKPFLEVAPWLIIPFKKAYDVQEDGSQTKNYYVNESIGIACGFLLTAIHQAGLVALTHTPSPMKFLQKILNRPENERPYLVIPVGFPADGVEVPDLSRKTLAEMAVFF